MQKREIPEFTSRLTKLQTVLVLLWLPVHVIGLPLLLILLGVIDAVELNFLLYVVGALFLLVVGFRYLRRDFDALADHPETRLPGRNPERVDINAMRAWRQKIHFAKMHSCGNDYIFVENFDGGITCPDGVIKVYKKAL